MIFATNQFQTIQSLHLWKKIPFIYWMTLLYSFFSICSYNCLYMFVISYSFWFNVYDMKYAKFIAGFSGSYQLIPSNSNLESDKKKEKKKLNIYSLVTNWCA